MVSESATNGWGFDVESEVDDDRAGHPRGFRLQATSLQRFQTERRHRRGHSQRAPNKLVRRRRIRKPMEV